MCWHSVHYHYQQRGYQNDHAWTSGRDDDNETDLTSI
jgi:hypothetical protein